MRDLLSRLGIVFVRRSDEGGRVREEGRDWPVFAHTMMGAIRLRHLRSCVERVLAEQIPGDLIEAGVWRGGGGIMMRGVLEAWNATDRDVWLADSFSGLPSPSAEHPQDARGWLHREPQLAVSRPEVEGNLRRYGLLDDRVHFVEGLFADTLPALRGREWSLLRLDGDMYGSTIDALTNLYPGVSPGGFVIIDDYGADGACRQAVTDYRREHGINEALQTIDWSGAYWRKPGASPDHPAPG